jgi:hypothetical protein
MADDNRLEAQKYKAINEAKALDRDLVAVVVENLRQLNDKPMEGLRFLAKER